MEFRVTLGLLFSTYKYFLLKSDLQVPWNAMTVKHMWLFKTQEKL